MMNNQNANSIKLVLRSSKEWVLMWVALSELPENQNLSEPTVAENLSESWQYMETTVGECLANSYHHFRHRMHPVKGANHRVKIPASTNFSQNDYFINEW
ncbi:hypothetical protein ABEG75_22785 [Pantoea agglomerans]|jgi:hypothetical protein|uniref:hypothetical protein n=1 Tax=Enterobacter agglomerans TaxID=549 RepID=UPI00165437B8|nr:hypothetical protein [Pantoea agglomerans]